MLILSSLKISKQPFSFVKIPERSLGFSSFPQHPSTGGAVVTLFAVVLLRTKSLQPASDTKQIRAVQPVIREFFDRFMFGYSCDGLRPFRRDV